MATAMQGEYRAARGADLAAKCADWMDANPDALRYIERRALEEAGAERRFDTQVDRSGGIVEQVALDGPFLGQG